VTEGDRSVPVVLRGLRDEGGLRSLEARRADDGGIVIEGQDMGPGVERAFGDGYTEYEWTWTIASDALPAAIAALGGSAGDDPLPLMAHWCAENGGRDPGIRLSDAGVPISFWSRIGD
jgi:hypothetical protein